MFSLILIRITLTWIFLTLIIVDCTPHGTVFRKQAERSLKNHALERSTIASLVECGLKCTTLKPKCKSFNYIKETSQTTICETNNITKHSAAKDDFVKQTNSDYFEPISVMYNQGSNEGHAFSDGLWTLIARFSNADTEHWMKDHAVWWYDKNKPYGKTHDPSDNTDMISEAFWLKSGAEFKISLSSDPTHTALLTTTGDCLEGKTFRGKMASYGVFRESTPWASNQCLGNCSVIYGGNYSIVGGFSRSSCDGDIQTRNNIGFWCHYVADGSVLMIGGGGNGCQRADHGIGITESNTAVFSTDKNERDFGNNCGDEPIASYSLNLWVR